MIPSAYAYGSVAQRRLAAMQRAVYAAARQHRMVISRQHLDFLVDAVTSALYPGEGRADPALAVGMDAHLQRTGEQLTDAELVVLRYAANGFSNPRIAHLIGRSLRTVVGHMISIQAKLGARDRTHAVALWCTSDAYRVGDVPVPELRT